MFALPVAVILCAVLTLGAVRPYQFLFLDCLCLVFAAFIACISFAKNRTVQWVWVIAAGLVALALGAPNHAPALMTGTWMAIAARRGNAAQTSRFMLFLVWLGVFEAGLGVIQYFWAPGWIFGLHNTHYRISGTLVNRNHFAGLLEMLVPVSIGGAYYSFLTKANKDRAPLYLVATVLMVAAILLSLSRMGIVSLAISLLMMSALVIGRYGKRRGSLYGGIFALALVLALAWPGIDDILSEFEKVRGQEDISLGDGRATTFMDALQMIRDNPFGMGPGQFQDRFRQYQRFNMRYRWDHAHNDYLEFMAELGIPVVVAVLGFLIGAFVFMVRKFERSRSPGIRGALLACIGTMTAIAIHSFADFNLQIPSNAVLFASLVGFGVGTAMRPEPTPWEH